MEQAQPQMGSWKLLHKNDKEGFIRHFDITQKLPPCHQRPDFSLSADPRRSGKEFPNREGMWVFPVVTALLFSVTSTSNENFYSSEREVTIPALVNSVTAETMQVFTAIMAAWICSHPCPEVDTIKIK